MTLSTWRVYLAAVVLMTFSPGPAVLLSISNAARQGPRASLYATLGNILGLLILGVIMQAGVGAALQSSVRVFAVLKLLGALYLMFLGIQRWRSGGIEFARSQPRQANRSDVQLFGQGVLVALTNPKFLVFFVTLFPQFLSTGSARATLNGVLGSVFVLAGLAMLRLKYAGA